MELNSKPAPIPVRVTFPDGAEYSATAESASRGVAMRGLDDLLRGLVSAPKPKGDRCPFCGWTDAEYLATGYVGCPLCYSSLASLRKE